MPVLEKTCVVVGVGPGVGLAVARRFAREGYHIGLVGRRAEALAEYAAQLSEFEPVTHGFPADMAQPEMIPRTFQHIRDHIGAPDVLVYNAMASHGSVPSSLRTDDLMSDLTVNVASALACVQEVLPHMREQGRGTILLTGGGLALRPDINYAALAIGKVGLRHLALMLADELTPEGIHVGTITIAGGVEPGTHFDPDKIAEVYWKLHTQARGQWEHEVVYR